MLTAFIFPAAVLAREAAVNYAHTNTKAAPEKTASLNLQKKQDDSVDIDDEGQRFPDDTPKITYEEYFRDMTTKHSQKELDKIRKTPSVKFFDISDPEAKQADTVALVSYPRSGNTLLRGYLERIMGLATGSGGSPSDKLIQALK